MNKRYYGDIPERIRQLSPEEREWYMKARELQKYNNKRLRAGDLVRYSKPGATKSYCGLILETRVEPIQPRPVRDKPAIKQIRIQWSGPIAEEDDIPNDESHWFNIWSYDHWRVVNR